MDDIKAIVLHHMRTIEPLYLVRRVKFDVFILKSTLFVFHGEPVKYYFTIYFYKPTSIRALSDALSNLQLDLLDH